MTKGGAWAGRAVWTLELFGIETWAVLDGGLIAWAGGRPPPRAGPTAGALHRSRRATLSAFPNPEPWATLEGVEVALDADTHCLWDARSPAEYAGFQRTAGATATSPVR